MGQYNFTGKNFIGENVSFLEGDTAYVIDAAYLPPERRYFVVDAEGNPYPARTVPNFPKSASGKKVTISHTDGGDPRNHYVHLETGVGGWIYTGFLTRQPAGKPVSEAEINEAIASILDTFTKAGG